MEQKVFRVSSFPLGRGVRLLEERADGGLLAFEKPADVLSHPNNERPCKKALLQLPYDFEQEAYRFEGKLIYLLHRLDAPTSGVILASTDPTLAQHIKQLFKQHLVKKTYLAIVRGFPPAQALWRDPIDIRNRHQTVRAKEGSVSGSGSQKIAQTEIVTLQRLSSTSQPFFLVELRPLTGFSHQLRFQCAKHHLPILGDQTYGDFKLNRWLKKQFSLNNLCLHAHQIQLPLPFSATSPLPEYFGLFGDLFRREYFLQKQPPPDLP